MGKGGRSYDIEAASSGDLENVFVDDFPVVVVLLPFLSEALWHGEVGWDLKVFEVIFGSANFFC